MFSICQQQFDEVPLELTDNILGKKQISNNENATIPALKKLMYLSALL